MRIRAIARNTFAAFLRNKLLILFLAIFLCVLLLFLTPLLMMRAAARPSSTAISPLIELVSGLLMMVSGFGSLLAAWAAADTVAGEMKSGTILAVMARPVRRWEFLLGKYLGVQMLMAVYILFMLGFTYLVAWIGGASLQTTPWVLIVYPLCRYAVYSALAMFLVNFMHPIAAFGAVLVTSILAWTLEPGSGFFDFVPAVLRSGLYALLPSTELLSEDRFLTITKASLQKIPWGTHAITIGYGLDYALVFFLLAVWAFRRRPLSRD